MVGEQATPALKQSGLNAAETNKWNAGQRAAVTAAQAMAVKKHGAFSWQNLQPMSGTGGVGMVSPDKASCINGGQDSNPGKGFVGLRKLCSEDGAKYSRDIPLFMTVWADRNEMGRAMGHGSCTEKADCARDTCKQIDPRGEVPCHAMPCHAMPCHAMYIACCTSLVLQRLLCRVAPLTAPLHK